MTEFRALPFVWTVTCASFLLLAGCAEDAPPPPEEATVAETPAGNAGNGGTDAAPPPLPEGIAPLPSSEESAVPAPTAMGETIAGAGIQFQLPEGWQQVPPTNSMRMAEATIPGEGGNGELSVFFFGPGGGGGVEPNLQRWAGQMELSGDPERQSFTTDAGLKVTWMDASGVLKASTMGVGPTTDQPGYRLFGAVVEGPGGPWFFKVTGPEVTLAPAREGFRALLASVRLSSPSA